MSSALPISRSTKPYICDVCDEPRDAHESPPAAAMDGDTLVCEECAADDTAPASCIMRERDEHKAAWAQEFTRANAPENASVRYVWINSDASENRMGRLYDCETGSPIAEGVDGGFVYGSRETGKLIVDALNAANLRLIVEGDPPMTDALPTCPDDQTERLIPLREIPATILDLRQRLAQAQTERNTAVNALAISRKNVDDLTDHAIAQGKHIADLGSQLAKSEALGTQWLDHYLAASVTKWRLREKVKALEKRADALAEYIVADMAHKGETRHDAHIRELIDEAGVDCPECEDLNRAACDRCEGMGVVLR